MNTAKGLPSDRRVSRLKAFLAAGVGVAAILGPISSWLSSPGNGQPLMASPQAVGDGQSIAVSSVNQSGGTTAGQIVGNQTMAANREALAASLEKLAAEIEQNPAVIGQQINVSAGAGSSGTTIGQRIVVTAGQGARGTVIGSQINVSAGQRDPADIQVAMELRKIAPEARMGTATRSGLQAAIDAAGRLANAAITAASRGATEELLKHYGI